MSSETHELWYPPDQPAQGRLVFINFPEHRLGSYPFLVTRVHPPCLASPRLQGISSGSIRVGQWDRWTRSQPGLRGLLHTPCTLALVLSHLSLQDCQALVAASSEAHSELGTAFELDT